MPAMHTSEEIRSDGSSTHSLPLCSVPLPLQISFVYNISFYFLSLPMLPSPPSFPPPVSPSFSLTPFLWLAVSLGLCAFQAGKSEALSKHQPPRSAQRNPSWLSPCCRPPCLPFLHFSSTASLTYELVECPLYSPLFCLTSILFCIIKSISKWDRALTSYGKYIIIVQSLVSAAH